MERVVERVMEIVVERVMERVMSTDYVGYLWNRQRWH